MSADTAVISVTTAVLFAAGAISCYQCIASARVKRAAVGTDGVAIGPRPSHHCTRNSTPAATTASAIAVTAALAVDALYRTNLRSYTSSVLLPPASTASFVAVVVVAVAAAAYAAVTSHTKVHLLAAAVRTDCAHNDGTVVVMVHRHSVASSPSRTTAVVPYPASPERHAARQRQAARALQPYPSWRRCPRVAVYGLSKLVGSVFLLPLLSIILTATLCPSCGSTARWVVVAVATAVTVAAGVAFSKPSPVAAASTPLLALVCDSAMLAWSSSATVPIRVRHMRCAGGCRRLP